MDERPPDKKEDTPKDWELVSNSALYRELAAQNEEILKHKWIESEKAGHDIGYGAALLDWLLHHRKGWDPKKSKS
jgi:hypothetical protein